MKNISYTDQKENDIKCDSTSSGLIFLDKKNYRAAKRKQEQLKSRLKKEFYLCKRTEINKFLDSISILFASNLLNEIIPYWYGTPWDFEGHTAIPNQGMIACGYFVSTTIRDMGLNINRYHLARQNPKNEARTLAIQNSLVLEFGRNDINEGLNELFTVKPGLYFIGLDNHVGYFFKTESCGFFIHSNYIENRVMIENAATSEAFESYQYILTKITNNKELMHHWLFDKEVVIVRN